MSRRIKVLNFHNIMREKRQKSIIRKPCFISLTNSKTLLLCRVRRIGFIPWEGMLLRVELKLVRKLVI
eukprot:04305.XXX_209709_209912_1 [CDS] Oithona nana genome sequencing.